MRTKEFKQIPHPKSDFTTGMIAMFCIQQLSMDMIGKANYGKYVTDFWVDTRWWYWPLFFIAWVVFVRLTQHASFRLDQTRWRLFRLIRKAEKDAGL